MNEEDVPEEKGFGEGEDIGEKRALKTTFGLKLFVRKKNESCTVFSVQQKKSLLTKKVCYSNDRK